MLQTSTSQQHKKPVKFKLVMLGDQAVGKTSIIKSYTHGRFDLKQQSTIGIDYMSKTVTCDSRGAILELWDTAGQERFRSLIPNYLKNCVAVLIVFDLTRQSSFRNVAVWRDFAKEVRGLGIKIFYIGNKADMLDERRVTEGQIEDMVLKEEGVMYFETSARSRECLENMFVKITETLMRDELVMLRISNRTPTKSLGEIAIPQELRKKKRTCCMRT